MVTRNSINNSSDTLSTTTMTATAIQAASVSFDGGTNTMSHYTVTTFTPSLAIGGSSTGISYAGRSGTLIRIGKLGVVTLNISLGSKGSNIGDLKISLGTTSNSAGSVFFGFVGEALTLPAGAQSPIGELQSNDVFLYYSSNGGSIAPMDESHISNASSFYLQFTFVTT
jgi:hypothetical protein